MSKVSVIIPTHNAARYLEQAVRSVQEQTHTDHEVVVVDDGSTDCTAAVMASLGDAIIAIHQENRGAAAARNAGVAASSGLYLAFLDADDWLSPDKLATQSRYLDSHPDVGLVAGGLEIVDVLGRRLGVHKPWIHVPVITLEALTYVGLVGVHGVLLRREYFDRVGGFDSAITHVEDMDLWWRLFVIGCQMAWLPTIVGSYRVHESSLSQSFVKHHEKRLALLDSHLERGQVGLFAAAKRQSVIAGMKVALAGRLYGAGDHPMAETALMDALVLDPALRDPARISDALAHWRQDPWVLNGDQVVRDALSSLPPHLSWIAGLEARIERSYWKSRFFAASLDHDRIEVIRSWMAIARRDLRWLTNRGGWSLLRKNLFSKAVIDEGI